MEVLNRDFYKVHHVHDHSQLTFNCVGFLCPEHTPDGSPCGLLNHLAATCQVLYSSPCIHCMYSNIRQQLGSLVMKHM